MTNAGQSHCFHSVWDALEDTHALAGQMKTRSMLMIALAEHIRSKGWTRAQAARETDVSEARIVDLLEGKIDQFSLTELTTMLDVAGVSAG